MGVGEYAEGAEYLVFVTRLTELGFTPLHENGSN